MWQQPKTDYTSSSNPGPGDFNRIEENILFLSGKISPFTWVQNHNYAIGDIVFNFAAGNSCKRMECVVAGTSGNVEPTWGAVGSLVTDNAAQWIVDDIRDGSLPGDIAPPSMIVRPGRIKTNGAIVNRVDYPRLTKFAVDNGLIVSEANWSAGLCGLFGAGDGSTTIRLPDIRGSVIRMLDEGVGADKFDIVGNVTLGNPTVSGITSTVILAVGMPISGAQIPANTTIQSITNNTTIVMSNNATATLSGAVIAVTGRVLGSLETADTKAPAGYGWIRISVENESNTVHGAIDANGSGHEPDIVTTPNQGGPETHARSIAYYATMKY